MLYPLSYGSKRQLHYAITLRIYFNNSTSEKQIVAIIIFKYEIKIYYFAGEAGYPSIADDGLLTLGDGRSRRIRWRWFYGWNLLARSNLTFQT